MEKYKIVIEIFRGGGANFFFKSVQNYNINSYIYIYGKLNHKFSITILYFSILMFGLAHSKIKK